MYWALTSGCQKQKQQQHRQWTETCFCSKKVHGKKHFYQRLLHSSYRLESIFRTMSRLGTQTGEQCFNGNQNEGGDDAGWTNPRRWQRLNPVGQMAGKLGFGENQLAGSKVKGRMNNITYRETIQWDKQNCSGADILYIYWNLLFTIPSIFSVDFFHLSHFDKTICFINCSLSNCRLSMPRNYLCKQQPHSPRACATK